MATATEVRVKPGDRRDNEIDKIYRQLIKHAGSDLHMQVGKAAHLAGPRHAARTADGADHQGADVGAVRSRSSASATSKIYEETGGCDFSYVVDARRRAVAVPREHADANGQPRHGFAKSRAVDPQLRGAVSAARSWRSCASSTREWCCWPGVTGSGKSTTIASMLDWINHNMRKHILTIEDPIEFVYTPDKCLINQREVGIDVKDFKIAMKHAVREDPDIMLVGEMRDMETFETAMHAAETGHLVFGTIHASSAPSTIGRILDLFPTDMHKALRGSMDFNMRGIVAQKLLKTICEDGKGPGRVPIVEIMTFNPTVRKLILEGEDEKLPAAMRIGKDEGMQRFNESLYDFLQKDMISPRRGVRDFAQRRGTEDDDQGNRRERGGDPVIGGRGGSSRTVWQQREMGREAVPVHRLERSSGCWLPPCLRLLC